MKRPVVVLTALIFLFTGPVMGKDAGTAYEFNNIKLNLNPQDFPEELTSIFYYPNSKVIISGLAGKEKYLSAMEGAILLETNDTADQVQDYYIKEIQKNGWRIIQSQKTDDGRLIMVESSFRNLVTIILRGETPTRVKIYFKRSGIE